MAKHKHYSKIRSLDQFNATLELKLDENEIYTKTFIGGCLSILLFVTTKMYAFQLFYTVLTFGNDDIQLSSQKVNVDELG